MQIEPRSLLPALALVGALGILPPPAHAADLSVGPDARAELYDRHVADAAIVDCRAAGARQPAIAPAETRAFEVGASALLTPLDGRDYTAAVWSPDGARIVFVAPTEAVRDLPHVQRALGAAAPSTPVASTPVAVSVNELWLDDLDDDTWRQITADGAKPVFSADGATLYYLAGTRHMAYSVAEGHALATGLATAASADGLLVATPTADGALMAPSLAAGDRLQPSADGSAALVHYASHGGASSGTPPFSVLHRADGSLLPIVRGCAAAALQMDWNEAAGLVAFPLFADQSEIRVVDTESGTAQVVLRLDRAERFAGVSLSPDGSSIAFALGDPRAGVPRLGVVARDGGSLQWLGDGMMPRWSPTGDRLLYAVPGDGQLFEWQVVRLEPADRSDALR